MSIHGASTIKEANKLLAPLNLKVQKDRHFRGHWAVVSARGTAHFYHTTKDKSHAVRWAFDLAAGRVKSPYGTEYRAPNPELRRIVKSLGR